MRSIAVGDGFSPALPYFEILINARTMRCTERWHELAACIN